MSWTVSDVSAYTDPACPGVVWCLWTATRASDGAHVDTGAVFMAPYCAVPYCNPDGSPRTLDMGTGTYDDWPSATNTTPTVDAWGFFATGLVSTVDPTTRTYTAGLESDSDALTNVPLTVSDPAVTSAVSSALGSFGGVPYATSGVIAFDLYGSPASISTTVGDSTYYGGIQVSSPVTGTPTITEPAVFSSSDPTVLTITTPYAGAGSGNTPDTFILNFLAPGTANLIVSFPSAAAPNLSQTIPVTVT